MSETLLIPELLGKESYEISPTSITVHKGSSFNPDNVQHTFSDIVRYGIVIQQYRDSGLFESADRARSIVSNYYRVFQGKDFTRLSVSEKFPLVRVGEIVFDNPRLFLLPYMMGSIIKEFKEVTSNGLYLHHCKDMDFRAILRNRSK